ncbi:MAG: hypothetical protein K8R85_02795 [Bacteroidetes bacterium]|nr:hypothetical protein [Bacteroidota bacterium]
MPGDNAATVAPGTAIDFPQDGETDGVIVRTSPSNFQLTAPGTYQVFFQVSVSEAGQLAIGIDGVEIARTLVGRASGTNQIVGMSIIKTTNPNSILTVLNSMGSAGAITITAIAGGTNPVSANLVIMRIK